MGEFEEEEMKIEDDAEVIRERCSKILAEDWEAVGRDFSAVGDDIRKVMGETDNMVEEGRKQ